MKDGKTKLSLEEISNLAESFTAKEKHWAKKPEVWLSAIPAILGLVLSYVAIIQAKKISQQETSIKHFDDLIANERILNIETDTLLRKMTAQLKLASGTNSLLRDQIIVLNNQLQLTNASNAQERVSQAHISQAYKNRLFITINTMNRIGYPQLDSASMVSRVKTVKALLETELQNPYLLQDSKMTEYWLYAYKCAYVFTYEQIKDIKYVWRNDMRSATTQADVDARNQAQFREFVRAVEDATEVVESFMLRDSTLKAFNYWPPKKIVDSVSFDYDF